MALVRHDLELRRVLRRTLLLQQHRDIDHILGDRELELGVVGPVLVLDATGRRGASPRAVDLDVLPERLAFLDANVGRVDVRHQRPLTWQRLAALGVRQHHCSRFGVVEHHLERLLGAIAHDVVQECHLVELVACTSPLAVISHDRSTCTLHLYGFHAFAQIHVRLGRMTM